MLRGTGAAVGWKMKISVHRPGARVPEQWRCRPQDDDRRLELNVDDDAEAPLDVKKDRRFDRHSQPVELETMQ